MSGRPVKEQVQSLGGKFVADRAWMPVPLKRKGGDAQQMGDEFYRKQLELDGQCRWQQGTVVITTAAIPGKKSPVLVTADMAARWAGLGDCRSGGRARRQLRADARPTSGWSSTA